MVEASCVYEVNSATDELVPIADSWGLPPKFSLLEPSKVTVRISMYILPFECILDL